MNKQQAFLRKLLNSELKEKGKPECTDNELKKAETSLFVFYQRELNDIALAKQKVLFDLIERRENSE